MKKKLLLPLGILFFLLNFSGKKISSGNNSVYGGMFRMNLTEDFRSLYPVSIFDNASEQIGAQIFEGLLKFDPRDLKIIPSLAKSWEADQTAENFMFHLRADVYFQDDACFPSGKGRRMTADDVKFCFGELLKQTPQNYNYGSTFSGIVSSDSAFVVINDSTISIHTSAPCNYLEEIIAQPGCWIYPHEAVEKYGDEMRTHAVGTGPFAVKSMQEGDFLILQKNPSYWRTDSAGNKLPYLDNIKFTFIKDKRSEIIAFKNKELDVEMDPIADVLSDLIASDISSFANSKPEFTLSRMEMFALHYIGFRDDVAPFNDVRVRQAFNYAIDRDKIVDYALQGGGYPIMKGFIPHGLPGYGGINTGYTYDVELSRKLLKQAGYAGGKGFPEITLETNSEGAKSITVVEEVVQMIHENLGINIKISVVPFAQLLNDEETGNAQMWRAGWISDCADPREFLQLAYGKNVPKDVTQPSVMNPMRFVDADFDKAFEKALMEPDRSIRALDYQNAEGIAADKAFIMPVYSPDSYILRYANVNGYDVNSLNRPDLAKVYLQK